MKRILWIVLFGIIVGGLVVSKTNAETLIASDSQTFSQGTVLYMPIVAKGYNLGNPNIRFGMSVDDTLNGKTEKRLYDAVGIPNGLRIDPYKWNVFPNVSSSTQKIRVCRAGLVRQQTCWENGIRGESVLRQHASVNKGQMYLIGNEPDNYDSNAGDGLKPSEYGRMFAELALVIRDADSSAKIIFGQTTFPVGLDRVNDRFPQSSGDVYLDKAYIEAKRRLGDMPHFINGFAVHNYQHITFSVWVEYMRHFENWVNGLDGDKFNGHPLYLTEYGKLNNRSGNFSQIQQQTTDWLTSQEGVQWHGAWWFTAACFQSLTLDGALFNSCGLQPKLTSAGETYKRVMQGVLR